MNSSIPIVRASRLYIRPFQNSDEDSLLSVVGDPEVMRLVDDGKPRTRDQVRAWIRRAQDRYNSDNWSTYAVIEAASNSLIGYAGFVSSHFDNDQVEVIYGLARDRWKQGYGGEIARCLCEWFFGLSKSSALYATVDPTNVASIRILKKLGMRHLLDRADEHGLPESLYRLDREKTTGEIAIEVIDSPDKAIIDFFDKRIEEFNVERWEIKEKKPIAVKVTNSEGNVVGGAAGKTFGAWLLLDNLWVAEDLRGNDIGTSILQKIESAAKGRGCKFVLLETLNFQAKPFYEKYDYQVQWIQNHYPRDGRKYFMIKELS